MTEEEPDSHDAGTNGAALRFGPYRLFTSQRLLLQGSRKVAIGSRAMDILLALVERPGSTLSRDDLITRAWPDTTVDDVNLRVHVSALRRALGDGQDGQSYFVTVPGRGYRFVGELASEQAPLLPVTTIQRARSATLPLPLTRIIGRSEVIARIRASLPQRRCITLVGPGGMGKTTVATAIADGMQLVYPDGTHWVDAAPLDRDEMVAAAVAFSLGLTNFTSDPTPGITASLQGKSALLVLDSCERVIAGAARMVEHIRHNAPGIHILATSREPLRVRGEHIVRLPPLGSPSASAGLTVAQAIEYPAVQLFVERASATLDGFALNDANVKAVVGICDRLDGIALAIELAAGHLAAFELGSLAALLDDKFRLMASGRRTARPRHQTMQAALEWSYDTLPDQERVLLCRLAVFGGAATLEAIRLIATDGMLDQDAAVASLSRLVDKSLVATEAGDMDVRYRLLDTTRAYAMAKLIARGEFPIVARRHAEYYQQHLQAMRLDGEQDSAGFYADLTADLANIRTALDWAAAPEGDFTIYVASTIAAVPMWMQLSLLNECQQRVGVAIATFERQDVQEPWSEMILRSAHVMSLMYTRGPIDESEAVWTRVLQLAKDVGDAEYQLRALYGLWLYKILVCEYRAGLQLAEQFRAVAEQRAGTADIATAERMTAMPLHYLGDQAGTRACLERSLGARLPANRHFDSTHYGVDQRVGALALLSRSLWLQGLADQAVSTAQASIDEAEKVGHANSTCVALADGAGLVAILVDDIAMAERFTGLLSANAEQHSLGVWHTYGIALRGRIRMRQGAAAEGIELLRSALAELRGTPFDIRFQLYLVWLAEALAADEHFTEALSSINAALERAERTEERWYFPELLRIRGELLSRLGEQAAAECFAQSLAWATQQGALSWELRTTISLVRWRLAPASALTAIIGRFTEGHQTSDLIAARHLVLERGH